MVYVYMYFCVSVHHMSWRQRLFFKIAKCVSTSITKFYQFDNEVKILNSRSLSLGNCALCILQLVFASICVCVCVCVCVYVCICVYMRVSTCVRARARGGSIFPAARYNLLYIATAPLNKPVVNLLFMIIIIFAI